MQSVPRATLWEMLLDLGGVQVGSLLLGREKRARCLAST